MEIKHYETEIKMPFMVLPVRSTLVSIKNARILLSPGSKLPREEYKKLEEITDLVATNNFHVAGIKKALQYFPQATVWVPTDAKIDFESQNIKILGRDPWPYTDQIEILEVKGIPQVNEFLFYLKEQKSIYVTDLFFNLVNTSGWGAAIILRLLGTYKKFGFSRFLNKFVKDKDLFLTSLRPLKQWSMETLIPSHGEILSGPISQLIEKALSERNYKF
jgi:hypothetical protein